MSFDGQRVISGSAGQFAYVRWYTPRVSTSVSQRSGQLAPLVSSGQQEASVRWARVCRLVVILTKHTIQFTAVSSVSLFSQNTRANKQRFVHPGPGIICLGECVT